MKGTKIQAEIKRIESRDKDKTRVAHKKSPGVDEKGEENYDTLSKSVFMVEMYIHRHDPRVHDDDHKTSVVMTSKLSPVLSLFSVRRINLFSNSFVVA